MGRDVKIRFLSSVSILPVDARIEDALVLSNQTEMAEYAALVRAGTDTAVVPFVWETEVALSATPRTSAYFKSQERVRPMCLAKILSARSGMEHLLPLPVSSHSPTRLPHAPDVWVGAEGWATDALAACVDENRVVWELAKGGEALVLRYSAMGSLLGTVHLDDLPPNFEKALIDSKLRPHMLALREQVFVGIGSILIRCFRKKIDWQQMPSPITGLRLVMAS